MPIHPTETLPDAPTASDAPLLTPTVAEIDLANLRRNVRVLKQRAGKAQVMGVVKADAYGHGAVPVARVLREEGVRYLAVATVAEAVRLREAGVEEEILVFAAPLPVFLPYYVRHDLEVTVSSMDVAEQAARTAREQRPLRVHVKVDTGMGRIGIQPDEAADVIRYLESVPEITIKGLWTHFAMADEEQETFTQQQIDRFGRIVGELGDAAEYVHLANSAALLRYAETYEPFGRALVRAGISLYGLSNLQRLVDEADLRPVMRFTSRITHVKAVAPGTGISYGQTWHAPAWRRVATVSAGYADGYPRLASNRAEVGVAGRRYPQAGNVCMDMFMVDLGDPSGPGATVGVGDEAVLFGPGGPTALEMANWAETIPYEVCCRVSARVPRVYRDDAASG